MKKIFLTVFSVFAILTLIAQPQIPGRNPQFQRPLPNQFRDFVDHQQKWNTERPKIEKKDGKVIITMTEEQFDRMRMMRQRPPMMMARFSQNNCEKCDKCHKKHGRRVKNFRK